MTVAVLPSLQAARSWSERRKDGKMENASVMTMHREDEKHLRVPEPQQAAEYFIASVLKAVPGLEDAVLSTAQLARRHLLQDASPLALQLMPSGDVEEIRCSLVEIPIALSSPRYWTEVSDFTAPDQLELLLHCFLILHPETEGRALCIDLTLEHEQWRYNDLCSAGAAPSEWSHSAYEAWRKGHANLMAAEQRATEGYWQGTEEDETSSAGQELMQGAPDKQREDHKSRKSMNDSKPASSKAESADTQALRQAFSGLYEMFKLLGGQDASEIFVRVAAEIAANG